MRANGQAYKGINVLMLWARCRAKGFVCPIWMTYRQAQELGGQVKKGEHGSLVVYADKITRTETDESGEEVAHEIAFMKGYTVFNCEQIEGLPAHFYAKATPPAFVAERIAAAEVSPPIPARPSGTAATGLSIPITGDYVQMPPFECFRDAESYYATLLHELTHWTRHETRLNREFGRKRWGDAGYAAEELVAELGAAFLCADLGVTPSPRGSLVLSRVLARSAEERQARHLHRRRACAARRRLSPRDHQRADHPNPNTGGLS